MASESTRTRRKRIQVRGVRMIDAKDAKVVAQIVNGDKKDVGTLGLLREGRKRRRKQPAQDNRQCWQRTTTNSRATHTAISNGRLPELSMTQSPSRLRRQECPRHRFRSPDSTENRSFSSIVAVFLQGRNAMLKGKPCPWDNGYRGPWGVPRAATSGNATAPPIPAVRAHRGRAVSPVPEYPGSGIATSYRDSNAPFQPMADQSSVTMASKACLHAPRSQFDKPPPANKSPPPNH